MSQHKHTPGPWTTRRVGYHDEYGDLYAIENHDGFVVAEFVVAEDAPLLHAAPDLLEALQALCADRYLADPINTERMAAARAAIAKATGDTP